ncbi:hypothetical protein [Plantactinospora sp. WMMB782]|uniref:hypothetical protein n=1 Tax=Plantactinospora sp. WMMB782 TaxID=3404121 RepID=UPI003B93BC17
MPQPQPEETAPAGRATSAGPAPAGPPPADGTATLAAGDQPARTGDRPDGRAVEPDDRSGEQPDDQGGEQPEARVGEPAEPADPAVPVPPKSAEVSARTVDVAPAEPDASPRTDTDTDLAENSDVDLDLPTRPTPPPGATAALDPSGTGTPAPPTGTETPAPSAGTETPAPPTGTETPAPSADDEGPAPTRVAAPRWTGSAAVPPPRPPGKRRWLRGEAEEVEAPAAPTARTQPVDPTLRMPEVELDEDEIPTPVDPWAGAADDPWEAHQPYPPPGGHGHPQPAPHPPVGGHAQPVPQHPPVGYDAPVSPPPARQLPVTRRFPAPPVPPPPPPSHPGPRPHGGPAPRPGPAAQPAPPPPPPPARPPAQSARPPAQSARPPAPPAPRKPPPPAAPPRPAKQRRRPEAPPVRKAPPAPAPPVRRRRRWPRVMFTLTLLTIVCCCGIPAYYAKPIWDQYPASPVDPLPSEVLDLRLLDNADGRQTAEQLKQEVRARNWLSGGEAFAGVYRASNGKRVVIFGSTGFQLSPESAVQDELTRLQDEYAVTSVEPVPTGVRGEYRSCGTGTVNGDEVVICTWADHGSLATALFTRLSIADSSELLSTLRDNIIVRDPVGSGTDNAGTS